MSHPVEKLKTALNQTIFALETVRNLTGNDSLTPYIDQAKKALVDYDREANNVGREPIWEHVGRDNVTVGCEVAFNKLDDATWFEVVAIDSRRQLITVREAGTDYAPQHSDMSLVKQARKAG